MGVAARWQRWSWRILVMGVLSAVAQIATAASDSTRVESKDALFSEPYIDIDEWRDTPVRHRYVHGGFKTISAYRANAASAQYSRDVAIQMYGGKRPFGYAYGGSGGGYFTDFWTKPGYLGFDHPERFKEDRLQYPASIAAIITAADAARQRIGIDASSEANRGGVDSAFRVPEGSAGQRVVGFRLKSTPPQTYFLGGDLIVGSGAANGKRIPLTRIVGDGGLGRRGHGCGQPGCRRRPGTGRQCQLPCRGNLSPAQGAGTGLQGLRRRGYFFRACSIAAIAERSCHSKNRSSIRQAWNLFPDTAGCWTTSGR